jgi:hypothetical protein
MRASLLGPAALGVILSVPAATRGQAPAARPADVASPQAVVRAMYEIVTRQPGQPFDWDRLRSLCLPGATMIPNEEQTGGELRILSVEDFIAWVDEQMAVGGPNDMGFQEAEIAQRIELYGDIAQVFSTYQKRVWTDPQILGRGINSIQLVFRDNRWWVVSVVWDEEDGAGAVPAKYLSSGS